MEPARYIDPLPWMTDASTQAVLGALAIDGATVRFVGGCVRDSLLGEPVRDIDIATPDPPSVVTNLLRDAGLRAIPTGVDHGTVTAVADDRHFEITTLRHDIETFGRRARVAFTDDWAVDATRRDFTINAMYCDAEGAIYDPTGGLVDLEAGHVRFVGDPFQRIDEDFLRILRFFRFQAWFGRTPPDETALSACRDRAPGLARLSAERIGGELLRLLAAPAPVDALRLMAQCEVLAQVLPEAEEMARLERLVELERAAAPDAQRRQAPDAQRRQAPDAQRRQAPDAQRRQAPDALRRLAAVLAVDGAGAGLVAERLRLSGAERERLVELAAPTVAVAAAMEPAAARRALHAVGADCFRDLVLLAWAGGDDKGADDWRRLLALAAEWETPELPVRGADVLDLGVGQGPRVGEIVAAIEAWWIEGDFAAGREEALKELERLVREGEG